MAYYFLLFSLQLTHAQRARMTVIETPSASTRGAPIVAGANTVSMATERFALVSTLGSLTEIRVTMKSEMKQSANSSAQFIHLQIQLHYTSEIS